MRLWSIFRHVICTHLYGTVLKKYFFFQRRKTAVVYEKVVALWGTGGFDR